VKSSVKKVVGASALGAISIVELLHLQQASATPVTFTGSTVANPKGGSVQVAITVDGASGTYRITAISTPVQPGGQNATYANIAIPTLTSEALAAQSASINGVSGASEVSAAWKSSLSSAIAQAAAAGEAIGTSSAPVAPATPNPTSTGTSTGTGSTAPAPVSNIPTSVAIAPTYYPFYASCNVSSGSNLSSLISQLSSDVNRIYSRGNGFSSDALSAANRDIANLQAASSQSGGSSTLSACISAADSGMQQWLANANVLFVKYYGQVVDAANKLYADAQASAAAIKAEPAPTVTVTVTATPKPSSGSVINKNVGVIKKSFTCTRTLAGITTRKIVKAFIVKCPVGFTLVKK